MSAPSLAFAKAIASFAVGTKELILMKESFDVASTEHLPIKHSSVEK